jgi:hypothetical protein
VTPPLRPPPHTSSPRTHAAPRPRQNGRDRRSIRLFGRHHAHAGRSSLQFHHLPLKLTERIGWRAPCVVVVLWCAVCVSLQEPHCCIQLCFCMLRTYTEGYILIISVYMCWRWLDRSIIFMRGGPTGYHPRIIHSKNLRLMMCRLLLLSVISHLFVFVERVNNPMICALMDFSWPLLVNS